MPTGAGGAHGLTPAAALLAANVIPPPAGRVLLLGSSHRALAAALARRVPEGEVWLVDRDWPALTAAQRALEAGGVANARVSPEATVLPAGAAAFDAVALEAPNDRQLARRWLAEAHAALKPEGQLYLAGANDEGIRPIIDDAGALFGNAVLLDYRKRNRIARAVKRADGADEPAWLRAPGIEPGSWREFTVDVRDCSFRVRSLPGIFAYDRLDGGTALLLAHLDVPRGARVLDAGCGYGIIGLLAARLGAARVDLVDVNLLAVAAAHENIARNRVEGARAFPSDLFSAVEGERYDLIVSNPPFHTGKAVSYDAAHALIDRAPHFLAPGGRLVLVANAFLPYDGRMRPLFKQVERLADTGRYQVLAATAPEGARAARRG